MKEVLSSLLLNGVLFLSFFSIGWDFTFGICQIWGFGLMHRHTLLSTLGLSSFCALMLI